MSHQLLLVGSDEIGCNSAKIEISQKEEKLMQKNEVILKYRKCFQSKTGKVTEKLTISYALDHRGSSFFPASF